MTIIEFYDKNALDNIAGALICRPEQIVLLGSNWYQMKNSSVAYKRVLRQNGISTDIKIVAVNKNDLSGVVEKLEQIVAETDECILDITGGDDVYLTAAGVIMERHKDKVECHRFNFAKETIDDCDDNGRVAYPVSFDVSVEDSIAIYGGELVLESDTGLQTYDWSFDSAFITDVENMWSICRENSGSWNSQIGLLSKICELYCEDGSLSVSYDADGASREIGRGTRRCYLGKRLLEDLQSYGLIRSLQVGEIVSFSFKNEQIKRCLTISGQVLELFIATRLRSILDKDKKPLYNDVRVGAIVNWDDDAEEGKMSIVNEMDIIAMKGAIPVFISCKNGLLVVDELYKLTAVANRFGGKYARKVLITANLSESNTNADYLRARMREMGIIHVDNVYSLSSYAFMRLLGTLWDG